MDELGDFAADIMPTMIALLPTAPPAPEGESVALSREELEGVWEGWITIDSLTISGLPAEEQQACEEQMEMIKGRQLPTQMEFVPDSDETGMVTVIDEQGISGEDGDEPIPYRYGDGLMVMEATEDEVTSRFEGRTLQTSQGTVMAGTWTSMGKMDQSELGIAPGGSELPEVSIQGRWGLTRTGQVLR